MSVLYMILFCLMLLGVAWAWCGPNTKGVNEAMANEHVSFGGRVADNLIRMFNGIEVLCECGQPAKYGGPLSQPPYYCESCRGSVVPAERKEG